MPGFAPRKVPSRKNPGVLSIRVSRREHHAFGKTKTLLRCEIRDHDDQLTDQLRGLTVARLDAGRPYGSFPHRHRA